MQTKKLIWTLVLLVSLVTPFCLGTLWFYGQLNVAKATAKTILDSKQDDFRYLELKFSQDDAVRLLDWEHAHEFSFKGEMYDVVQVVNLGDSVLYYCYHDIKESKLQKAFQAFLGGYLNNHPYGSKQQKQTETFFKSLYLSHGQEPDMAGITFYKPDTTSLYVPMHSDYFEKPISPPPQSGC